MSFKKIFDKVFEIDPLIRYVAVYHNGKLDGIMREGVQRLLGESETKELLQDSIKRWQTRKNFSSIIGGQIYSMSMFSYIKRFTMRVGERSLLLITTEIEVENEELLLKLLDLKNEIHEILKVVEA